MPYFRLKDWIHPPVSEKYRLAAVADLADAREDLTNELRLDVGVSNSILRRIQNLESQLVGGEGDVFLSTNISVGARSQSNAIAAITNVIPSFITVTNSVNPLTVVFFGKGLNLVKTGTNGVPAGNEVVTMLYPDHGMVTNSASLRRVGQDLVLNLTATNLSGPMLFGFTLTNAEKSRIVSWPFAVNVIKPKPPTNALPALRFTEAVTNSAGPQSVDYTVTVFTNITDHQADIAQGLIRADLEKNKPVVDPPTNTVLKVSVGPDAPPIGLKNSISVLPK